MFRALNIGLLLTVLLIGGCNGATDQTYNRLPVRGTVLIDGEPLAHGSIVFYPEAQSSVISGAEIRVGRFEIPLSQGLPVGRYKVSVTATDENETADMDQDELMEHPPNPKSLIPAKYNTESTLVFEVAAATKNVCNLELWIE